MKEPNNATEKTKVCTKCKQEKVLSDFYKSSTIQDGWERKCIECYKQNYLDNKKRFSLRNKKYYQENEETFRKYRNKYKLKNKEYLKKYLEKYRSENRTKAKEASKKYYRENKERIIKRQQEYENKHQKNKPKHKIRHSVATRINAALKSQNTNKNNKSIKYIGCTIIEYQQYLQQQFKPEMTWENHGTIWEIDHIKPCSSFDLTDSHQQQECFHYTNTQPLFKTTEIAESFGYMDQMGNRNKNKY